MQIKSALFFPVIRYQAELFSKIADLLIEKGYIKEAVFLAPSLSGYYYLKSLGKITVIFTPQLYIEYSKKHSEVKNLDKQNSESAIFELKKKRIEDSWNINSLNLSDEDILLQNSTYLNIWKDFIEKNEFGLIFVWNGYIIPQATLLSVAKMKQLKVLYFENGYEPSTFVMDNKGINFRSNFRNIEFESQLVSFESSSLIPYRNTIKNFTCYLFNQYKTFVAKKNKKYKPLLRYEFSQSVIYKIGNLYSKIFCQSKNLPKEPYIFFPLQVITDSQLIDNYVEEQESAILQVSKAIDSINKIKNQSIRLIVKDHPRQESFKYLHKLIEKKNIDHVSFIRSGDTKRLVENALAVVTINSSVGYQALKLKKNVFVLGDSLYEGDGLAKKVDNWDIFKRDIISTIDNKISLVDDEKLDEFVERYRRYCYVTEFDTDTKERFLKNMVYLLT